MSIQDARRVSSRQPPQQSRNRIASIKLPPEPEPVRLSSQFDIGTSDVDDGAVSVALMSVHDADTYRKYTDRTPPAVRMYGGRFLTRGEPVTTVEGEDY